MLFMDLLQGIGLDLNGRNLVNMFAGVLKNNTAAQKIRDMAVLLRINDSGTWELHDEAALLMILSDRVLHGKMQIICDHADDHIVIIMHLTLEMIVLCAID